MVLEGVCLVSICNPTWRWEESVTCGDWLLLLLVISHPVGLLSELWRPPCRAMTASSQSHDRLLIEP